MIVTNVKVHIGGVRDCLKSGGVVSELRTHCEHAAARCNGLVQWHSPMNSPAYKAVVDEAKYTAVGKVVMNTGLGTDGNAVEHENAAHDTLMRGCGW